MKDIILNKLNTGAKTSIVDSINEANSGLTSHTANKSNPHGVTKAQVGLGSVVNQGISTTAEATAGTVNTSYMTPVRTAEAINAKITTHAAVAASTTATGHVQLNSTLTSTSTTQAATASTVKTLQDTKAGTAVATTSANGLMSSTDKTKLDGIAASANNYSLPTATASVLGGVKNGENIVNTAGVLSVNNGSTTAKGVLQLVDSVSSTSTINAATPAAVKMAYDLAATKADTAVATTSANGLMSSADKSKLNGIAASANNYSLPTATASVLGGVKTGTNIVNTSGVISVAAGTTSAAGVVQLSSATNSTSTALAATASAVKAAYDLAGTKAGTAVATESANGLMPAADKTKVNKLFNSGRYLTTKGSILGAANTVMKANTFYVVTTRPAANTMTLEAGPTALTTGTRLLVNAIDTANYIATVTAYNATTKVVTVTWNDAVAPASDLRFRFAMTIMESATTTAVSLGTNAIAAGEHSSTIGGQGPAAIAENAIAGGYSAEATAFNAVAIGYEAKASENNAVSLGYNNKASGQNSFATNRSNTASGNAASAFGGSTTASGDSSFTAGTSTTASFSNAVAMGWATSSSGHSSTALGYGTTATNFATLALGKYNSMSLINTSNSTDTMSAIVLGNGTTADARSNAFRVTYAGKVYGKAEFVSSGADYAEYFEWMDGNEEGEDRRGIVVALEGEKIRPAKATDEYILGIVSATPSVVGDAQDMDWQGRFIKDEWGSLVYGWVDSEQVNPETSEPEIVKQWLPMPNPEWNPEEVYVPREERAEWEKIGLVGKLSARHDGTCLPNGFAKVSEEDGLLTHSSEPTNIRVMTRLTDRIVRVFVK